MKITFGLVVYNEEAVIERCLSSIKDVADEIIVIHDGECTDKTLEIARRFTDKIFVGERMEGSEPHRISILEKSRNDWVFMIDADEFLSPGLKDFLQSELEQLKDGCQTFAFNWPIWDGTGYVTKGNFRPCLFDRRHCWSIALHNFSIQTVGKICNISQIIEHRPKNSKVGLGLLKGALNVRINRDASRFMIGFDGLPKYNEKLIPSEFKQWFGRYTRHPRAYAFINLVKHFAGSYKNLYKDGRNGFIVSLQLGLYQYKLAMTIWQMDKKSKSH